MTYWNLPLPHVTKALKSNDRFVLKGLQEKSTRHVRCNFKGMDTKPGKTTAGIFYFSPPA